MADKITFDRAGAGIVEKKQWQDAESLGQIGASAGRISSSGVAVALPGPGGSGPQELTSAVDAFNKAMSMVILEYSDAASIFAQAQLPLSLPSPCRWPLRLHPAGLPLVQL